MGCSLWGLLLQRLELQSGCFKTMEIKLNLASKPYMNRQGIRLWLLLLCSVMGVLLVLNISYAYNSYQQLKVLDERFEELNEQVAGIQDAPAGFSPARHAAVKSEVVLINQIVAEDQFRWTGLLGRFEELVPENVSVSSIQPNFKERSVQLSGVARDMSALTKLLDNLLTSADFNKAYLLNHSEVERKQNGTSSVLTGFSLVIREAF